MADLNQSLESAASSLQKVADSLLATPQATQGGSTALNQAQQSLQQFQQPWAQPLVQHQGTLLQRLQLARTELEVVRAQSRLEHYRNPSSAYLARARLAAEMRLGTTEAKLGTAQMRTETEWMRTPQGRHELREQARAERERSEAQRAHARAREDALSDTPRKIARFADATVAAGKQLYGFVGKLQMAQDFMLSFASKASPQKVATYQGSMDMLMARIGSVFLPLLDRLSAEMQEKAKYLDTKEGKGVLDHIANTFKYAPEALKGLGAGSAPSLFFRQGFQGMSWLSRQIGLGDPSSLLKDEKGKDKADWLSSTARWLMGSESAPDKPGKISLAGFPAPQETTADRFQVQLMMAGLTMGRNTTEADVMRVQMEKLVGLIEKVEHNTRPAAPFR